MYNRKYFENIFLFFSVYLNDRDYLQLKNMKVIYLNDVCIKKKRQEITAYNKTNKTKFIFLGLLLVLPVVRQQF